MMLEQAKQEDQPFLLWSDLAHRVETAALQFLIEVAREGAAIPIDPQVAECSATSIQDPDLEALIDGRRSHLMKLNIRRTAPESDLQGTA